jgi:hypothetical protein
MKKGLHIQPPPKDSDPVFPVVYVIDVGARNIADAAWTAYDMMIASDSLPPVLEVIDNRGNKVRIDLSQSRRKGSFPCQSKPKPNRRLNSKSS